MAWDRVRGGDKSAVPPVVSGVNKPMDQMISDALKQFGEFDIALVDTRGHDSEDTARVAVASDAILIPLTPSSLFDTDAMALTAGAVRAARKTNNALVILNKCRSYPKPFEHPRTRMAREVIAENYGLPVADQSINLYNGIEDSLGAGSTIIQSDSKSRGAEQYRELAKEIAAKLGLNGDN